MLTVTELASLMNDEVRCAFPTMDSAVLGLASLGCGCCMVRVFRRILALEDAIELHTFVPLEALPCV
jgi:hypothetical protein